MAEESSDPLVTPEKIELDTRNISKNSAGNSGSLSNGRSTHLDNRRASIGSYHAGDSSTMKSKEKSDSAKSSQNVIPHYLRASTGSCHDFCKYGRKHLSEEKAWKPVRKRNSKPLPHEMYSVQIVVAGEQKKEKVVDHKLPTDVKNHSPDVKPSPDPKSYSPKPKTSLDKAKVVKQKPSTDAKNHSPDLPSSDTKSYLRKPKMSLDAKTSPRTNASSGSKPVLPKNKPSSAKNFPSPEPPEIVKSESFSFKKVERYPVNQGSSADNKMSRAEKKTTYLPKQRSSPVQSKPVKVIKPSSSSDNSDGVNGKGRRNSEYETGRNMRASKALVKKLLAPPAATLSPKLSVIRIASTKSRKAGNLKLVSPLKDRNRIRRVKTKTSNDEKVSEKTLHVIKTETVNNVLESILNDHAILAPPSPSSAISLAHEKSSSLSSLKEDNEEIQSIGGEADEIIPDNDESLKIDKVPPIKENHNKTPKKSKVVVSEDKRAVKLKFRSGKVVDLQSDNNAPRRLRFRRARVLGPEDTKGDSRRRNLKKAGGNDDATGLGPSSTKVVLKHQNVQDKKEAQGLSLNNVIEETASKLVETRKSKVKALVGAFETVISLQESKPSTQTVS